MDAISFVLGVKSAQLRSSQLKDLVYRGRKLGVDGDGDGSADAEEEDDAADGEGTAKKAWVLAIYEDEKREEWRFQRTLVAFHRLLYETRCSIYLTHSGYPPRVPRNIS
jgi:structural maintenance of chromosome 1